VVEVTVAAARPIRRRRRSTGPGMTVAIRRKSLL